MDFARTFYGTKKTWFLVNGSTCGLLAAIAATTEIGETVLIGRNCHKAVYHGALLRNLKVEYVYPSYISKYGICGGYDPDEIDRMMSENPKIKVVVLTSPTYDGIVSDIKKIAEIVHRHQGVLIVDEAHGAHFCLFENGPKPAYQLGADLVIESLHKTLPALTQTAVLHNMSDAVSEGKIEQALSIFETSSPSYILMGSIDHCIRFMKENGKEEMKKLLCLIRKLREEKFRVIQMPGKELIGRDGVYDVDETKLLFSVPGGELSGFELADRLRRSFEFEMEMAAPSYALGISTICDSKEGLEGLFDAIKAVDDTLENRCDSLQDFSLDRNEVRYSVYETGKLECETVELKDAEGRISAEFVYFYPPGIPLIVPGEVISKAVMEKVLFGKDRGAQVNGLADREARCIRVVK
jgi:arginine/lysine/ornithine decarboxylase